MAAELLADCSKLDVSRPLYGKDALRKYNPQRFEMEMVDGIVLLDAERSVIVGFLEITNGAWWARGHFPDRPLFPGVLALEAAGQVCSFYFHRTHSNLRMGLGAVDTVKFRLPIEPPTTLFIAAKVLTTRNRFAKFQVQGIVKEQLAFESVFTGAAL